MANTSQDILNSGGSSTTQGNLVGWRDANNSIGSMFGDSGLTPTATAGNITLGDRILGGTSKSSLKFGIVKILVLLAGVAIVVKILKGKK